jgi:hypothetical protein
VHVDPIHHVNDRRHQHTELVTRPMNSPSRESCSRGAVASARIQRYGRLRGAPSCDRDGTGSPLQGWAAGRLRDVYSSQLKSKGAAGRPLQASGWSGRHPRGCRETRRMGVDRLGSRIVRTPALRGSRRPPPCTVTERVTGPPLRRALIDPPREKRRASR